ncbi:MAG: acetate--CoA ligase family protein, partial [Gammaproteobacteria bacterium]|nr:acetate--CoA ligase family protein [Gammaproteobacteria bacterium]
MNLHEYQSKELFDQYGVPTGPGQPARSADEAVAAARALGGEAWLVKAQVHAGGRGKAGGVKMARSLEEVESTATAMLGSQLVTVQSAPDGQPVNCVMVAGAVDIASELYLGMVVDRDSRRVAIMASTEGGMDIEHVAATTPEKIVTVKIDPVLGLQPYQCRRVAFGLGLSGDQVKQ